MEEPPSKKNKVETPMKYVVVTGGVVSGLGKGVTISSIGRMLKGCGLRVTSIKIDPYLNVDAGTMSPFEHGEVFVLKDGGESDLDLGNYERFLSIELTSDHNITTGKIYREVIARERRGDYLGKTVQIIPHISTEIQNWIERVSQIPVDGSGLRPDVCLIEVGGTVGDIESMVFLEALRQFQFRVGKENFCLMFVSLVPVLGSVGEQKTKPTQHGIKELRSLGLTPSVILCRSTEKLNANACEKISGFCHVSQDCVLSVHDVNNIYHVPLLLIAQNLHLILTRELKLSYPVNPPNMLDWECMANKVDGFKEQVKIAIVGKYTGLQDSYLSVIKSVKHASIACERDLDLIWVEASHLEKQSECNGKEFSNDYENAWKNLKSADGVIVPGGFGNRGFLGKVLAAEYCRTSNKPFLGICLGFQAMVVEYCRNILKWENANSTEFDENCPPHDVVIFMPEVDKENMGGTMRLGARMTKFVSRHHPTNGEGSKGKTATISTAQILYGGKEEVSERHRHRYEVNPKKAQEINDAGLEFVGKDETGTRMEVAELPRSKHKYYLGCQYHPEFQSRPLDPSPPFYGLVMAACDMLDEYITKNIPPN